MYLYCTMRSQYAGMRISVLSQYLHCYFSSLNLLTAADLLNKLFCSFVIMLALYNQLSVLFRILQYSPHWPTQINFSDNDC